MLKEFKTFIMRGNVLDLAVGVVIGAAFGKMVDSLVKDVIMPPIGLLLGNIDFSRWFIVLKDNAAKGPYLSLEAAHNAGAITLNLGLFFNALISFLIISFAIFIVVKAVNRMHVLPQASLIKPAKKQCPHCDSSIPIKASRCPCCTSDL